MEIRLICNEKKAEIQRKKEMKKIETKYIEPISFESISIIVEARESTEYKYLL